jgi:hypothetical protein
LNEEEKGGGIKLSERVCFSASFVVHFFRVLEFSIIELMNNCQKGFPILSGNIYYPLIHAANSNNAKTYQEKKRNEKSFNDRSL